MVLPSRFLSIGPPGRAGGGQPTAARWKWIPLVGFTSLAPCFQVDFDERKRRFAHFNPSDNSRESSRNPVSVQHSGANPVEVGHESVDDNRHGDGCENEGAEHRRHRSEQVAEDEVDHGERREDANTDHERASWCFVAAEPVRGCCRSWCSSGCPFAQPHQVPLDELVGAPEVGDPRIRPTPRKRNAVSSSL